VPFGSQKSWLFLVSWAKQLTEKTRNAHRYNEVSFIWSREVWGRMPVVAHYLDFFFKLKLHFLHIFVQIIILI
jgi:hypothetical protein